MRKRNFVFTRGAGGWPTYRLLAGLGVLGMAIGVASAAADTPFPAVNFVLGLDSSGITGTLKADGPFKTNGRSSRVSAANGRSCATCHVSTEAMSFTPGHARLLLDATHGSDPLFAVVDGANCPEVARSTRAGHSLLLQRRVDPHRAGRTVNAQYSISVVHDPYGCALRVDPITHVLTRFGVSAPRLPSTNLSFLSGP